MFSVIIPFRPNPHEPNRTKSFHYVQDFWLKNFDCEIEYCDSRSSKFNRSEARNNGVKKARNKELVICDADTFCDIGNVQKALDIVKKGHWVLPYTRYYRLSELFSDHVINNNIDIITKPFYDIVFVRNSWSGVICLDKDMFYDAGGYNEEYQGWGFEDYEFKNNLDKAVGHHVRTNGGSYHLWHETEPNSTKDSPTYDLNKKIYEDSR